MLTQITRFQERFNKWRGTDAQRETNFINFAMAVNSYVDATQTLKQIELDLSSNQTAQFKTLESYNHRSLGCLLYGKLIVDGLLEPLLASNIVDK